MTSPAFLSVYQCNAHLSALQLEGKERGRDGDRVHVRDGE